MVERDAGSSATGPPKRRWKLWHLALAVFASALVFGALRAAAREPNGPMIGGMSAAVLIALSGAVCLASFYLAKKLGGWATGGLTRWAIRRGGVVGFCVWVVGIGINVGLILGAIVIGPVATILFLIRLFQGLGRL